MYNSPVTVTNASRCSWLRLGGLMVACVLLTSCANLGYYAQSVHGHASVLNAARPVEEVIADPATQPRLRNRLELAMQIRQFASQELGLPNNRSYTQYADIQRQFVVWNVVATPALSLQLKSWCFAVVGCVSYRGFYEQAQADAYAKTLEQEGFETYVGGVPAYSTLGWTADPLLSSFIHYSEVELARLIFHELAHQVAYAKDDSKFNESFATAVELVGVQRWLAATGRTQQAQAFVDVRKRQQDFLELLLQTRSELSVIFTSNTTEPEKRAAKQLAFERLRERYQTIKTTRWNGFAGFDRWFNQPINTARIAAIATYNDYVPAFERMLDAQGGDLPRFYVQVQQLARQPSTERKATLQALMPTNIANATVQQH